MDALLRRRAMIATGGSPTPPPTPTPEFYDYLYFDGVAYIDTDITPPTDFSIRFGMGKETNKAAQRVFACLAANSTSCGMLYNSSTTSTNRSIAVYYGTSGTATTARTLAFSTDSFQFFLTPNKFGFGNTSYNITKGANAPSGPLTFGSNPSHSGNPFSGRIATIRIYDSTAQNATSPADLLNNYTQMYTLKPCKYNGEDGLWCEELSKFYGNTAGAGTLTASNS